VKTKVFKTINMNLGFILMVFFSGGCGESLSQDDQLPETREKVNVTNLTSLSEVDRFPAIEGALLEVPLWSDVELESSLVQGQNISALLFVLKKSCPQRLLNLREEVILKLSNQLGAFPNLPMVLGEAGGEKARDYLYAILKLHPEESLSISMALGKNSSKGIAEFLAQKFFEEKKRPRVDWLAGFARITNPISPSLFRSVVASLDHRQEAITLAQTPRRLSTEELLAFMEVGSWSALFMQEWCLKNPQWGSAPFLGAMESLLDKGKSDEARMLYFSDGFRNIKLVEQEHLSRLGNIQKRLGVPSTP
jgi:hypothetical protein